MGEDNVVSLFGDLVEPGTPAPFPGKRPLVDHSASQVPDVPVEWYENPQAHVIAGEARSMYPISKVALAFGRSVQTIRGWEISGSLPPTRYRTQAPRHSLPGATPKGRRLWTREQIDGMLVIASQEECIINGGPPPTVRWTERVRALFIELAKQNK